MLDFFEKNKKDQDFQQPAWNFFKRLKILKPQKDELIEFSKISNQSDALDYTDVYYLRWAANSLSQKTNKHLILEILTRAGQMYQIEDITG